MLKKAKQTHPHAQALADKISVTLLRVEQELSHFRKILLAEQVKKRLHMEIMSSSLAQLTILDATENLSS